MFKRFNRSKEPTSISSPTGVLETTLPEGYLESIPEVRGEAGSVKSPGLPNLPFRAVPPLDQAKLGVPGDRASSEYSQPSPAFRPELSPPTSPVYPDSYSEQLDVSPVETSAPPFPVSRKETATKESQDPRSGLPAPRKPAPGIENTIKRFGNSPGWRIDPKSIGKTKWNAYTGEPTVGEEGKAGSVKPGNSSQFASARDKSKQALSVLRSRDPAQRKKPQQKADNELPADRPPWQGGSGRQAIMSPIRDDPSKKLAPIQIPPNTNIRATATNDTLRSVPPDVPPHTSVDDPVKPVVPLKTGALSPRIRSPAGPMSPKSMNVSRKASPAAAKPARTARSPAAPEDPRFPQALVSGALPVRQPQARVPEPSRQLSVDDEPGSRFSTTTVATSQASQSPRPSYDAPPVPVVPARSKMRLGRLSSNESRSPWDLPGRTVNRKPTPSSIYSTASGRDKSLPQCPPETLANDKVSILKAREEDLERRERNLEKVKRDLSHVVNPTSPGYDLRTKLEVKATLDKIELELADIRLEKAQVGIKRTKAQKKQFESLDEGGYASPWIKNVTYGMY